MKRGLVALVVAVATCGGHAMAADSPLYVDFQQFCVATGAKPHAVKALLAAAHMTPHPEAAATPDIDAKWDHSLGGHTLTIGYGSQRIDAPDGRANILQEDCLVASREADDEGAAAITNWAGVRPGISHLGPMTEFFQFRDDGGKRTPLADGDKAAWTQAINDGVAWQLLVNTSPGGAFAYAVHFPAPEAK